MADVMCEYCGDSGDVHRRDGSWVGLCTCPAGAAPITPVPLAFAGADPFADSVNGRPYQFAHISEHGGVCPACGEVLAAGDMYVLDGDAEIHRECGQ